MLRCRNRGVRAHRGTWQLGGPTSGGEATSATSGNRAPSKREGETQKSSACHIVQKVSAALPRGSSCASSWQAEHCTRPACPYLHKPAEPTPRRDSSLRARKRRARRPAGCVAATGDPSPSHLSAASPPRRSQAVEDACFWPGCFAQSGSSRKRSETKNEKEKVNFEKNETAAPHSPLTFFTLQF
jgi:hypothetical protein